MPLMTSTKKRLSPTLSYLLVGLVLGWPGLIATSRLLPVWGIGEALTPLSLATIHALVLGFMMTVAFGVMYQIVPIAFQAPPLPRHILFWHLPLHVLLVLLMVAGFLRMDNVIVGLCGILVVVCTASFFVFVIRSYIRARNKTAVHKALSVPILALWAVLLVGVVQALSPGSITESLIFIHVLLGGCAFWEGLVFVLSYKLMPMFAISHGYKAYLPRNACLYFIGTLLLHSS